MFKRILLITLVVAIFCPLTAMGSMYVGASIGNAWQSTTTDASEVFDEVKNIDKNSTGWKIFGGFKSESFFGIEGGYRDLGEIEDKVSGYTYKTSTNGWDVEAIGSLELSVIRLFAKAGAFFWSADASYGTATASDSGTDFLWGLGAGVSLGPVGVRLEWESMEVGYMDNLSMLSLGASLGF
jgi:OOP family OmpA-OmpF porin